MLRSIRTSTVLVAPTVAVAIAIIVAVAAAIIVAIAAADLQDRVVIVYYILAWYGIERYGAVCWRAGWVGHTVHGTIFTSLHITSLQSSPPSLCSVMVSYILLLLSPSLSSKLRYCSARITPLSHDSLHSRMTHSTLT